MTSVFLDTSYLLALELANDQNHPAAVRHWQQVSKTVPHLVTTSYVFDECCLTKPSLSSTAAATTPKPSKWGTHSSVAPPFR